MGRWRPKNHFTLERGSKYITPAGAETLQKELTHLWKVERPQVTEKVHEAAKNGDRSENGDYIYGKRRMAEIDRRVRYLSKRLDELTIVYDKPKETDKVFFAAHVTLEDESGDQLTYQIVGSDEFDLQKRKISMDSPLGKSLLGKRLDDEVDVVTNGKAAIQFIVDITY